MDNQSQFDRMKTQEELMRSLQEQINQTPECSVMQEIATPGVDTRINKD